MPHEMDTAELYFRLCAAQAVPQCQYRLAKLMLDAPRRLERNYVQAVAWMQLAADQGLAEAKEIASKETESLSQRRPLGWKVSRFNSSAGSGASPHPRGRLQNFGECAKRHLTILPAHVVVRDRAHRGCVDRIDEHATIFEFFADGRSRHARG